MAEKEDRKGPDEVIYELGGCGRFQIQFALMIHTMNIVIVWCLNSMIFITAVPKWRCTNEQNTTEATDNTFEEKCIVHNGTECSSFEFSEDMHTIVDEVRNLMSNRQIKNYVEIKATMLYSLLRCTTYIW